MKEVNLEAILKSKLGTVETMRVNNPDYTWNKTIEAMKEACKLSIELCKENYMRAFMSVHESETKAISDTINQIV